MTFLIEYLAILAALCLLFAGLGWLAELYVNWRQS